MLPETKLWQQFYAVQTTGGYYFVRERFMGLYRSKSPPAVFTLQEAIKIVDQLRSGKTRWRAVVGLSEKCPINLAAQQAAPQEN